MIDEHKQLIPVWPEKLGDVDIVKVSFALDFLSPCTVQPADFLGLGRSLRLTGRQLLDTDDSVSAQQWEALFQPPLSDDPVALRKFQKPAPSFVMTMPLTAERILDAGDRINLDLLFIGTGIPSIHCFLRGLVHLGKLGLISGEGHYDLTEVRAMQPDGAYVQVWREGAPLDSLSFPVLNLMWLVRKDQIPAQVMVRFNTPARIMKDGKPLRKPRFTQLVPFMLRRVTSMLFAHSGVEIMDDYAPLIEQAQNVNVVAESLRWCDWRMLPGQQGEMIGGFIGEVELKGDALEEIYWLLVVASLLGFGKGATYGAGSFIVEPC